MTIDIALPFYGDVDFMKETVTSVINQTDVDWHLQLWMMAIQTTHYPNGSQT